ncbi:MAG: gamma-glutamyl-gamma-aminobutyrate hydrolase family protein [Nitrospinae bacterium]|nr:gamma-glutamyl-gamma-aminobutyrate hydrolase family protein [Nitrospinota bacterium]
MSKSASPLIGITVDTNYGSEDREIQSGLNPRGQSVFWLKKSYTDAVEKSGGVPVLIPVVATPAIMDRYLEIIDGLIISGGEFDIDPKLYGERKIPLCGALKPDRTLMEMRLLKKGLKMKMPVLGVCGGHQVINVAFGGSLYQDIPSQAGGPVKHEQKPVPSTQASHDVEIAEGTLLAAVIGARKIKVNSTHHQGIKKLGRGLCASGKAIDGLVEAVERKGDKGPFLLGTQWHPEQLYNKDQASRKIFKKFMEACVVFNSLKTKIKR